MDELGSVLEKVARYFSLLAEPMRLRILHAICQGERSVTEIIAETGATQTAVSRHLNIMYRAGVLSRRRQAGFIHYGVADPVLTDICRTVCVRIAGRQADDQADQAGLAEFVRELEAFGRREAARAAGTDAPCGVQASEGAG